MVKLKWTVVALFCFLCQCLHAQTTPKKSRILFILDASSSMTFPWGNSESKRFDIASNILLRTIDSIYAINNEVQFAVRAYGTQHPAQEKNCTDTELEVPFNFQNVSQIKTRLKYIKPIGFSPIAYSLQQAAKTELANTNEYDYSIIFITDGGESCNGDICNTFATLIANKVKVNPYIIGLDQNDQLKSYYACLGKYIEVNKPQDIDLAIKMIVDANRILLEKPKTLKLTTTFSGEKEVKPAVNSKPEKAELQLLKLAYLKSPKDNVSIKSLKPLAFKKSRIKIPFEFEVIKLDRGEEFGIHKQSYFMLSNLARSQIGLSTPKSLAYKKKAKLNLNFEFEKPIVKKMFELESRSIFQTSLKKIDLRPLSLKTVSLVKKPKAIVKFDFPIERQSFDIRTLIPPPPINLTISKSVKTQVKTIKPIKVKLVTLKFNFPVDRDSFQLKNLTLVESSFLKQTPNSIVNTKEIAYKKSKIKLAFNLEEVKKEELQKLILGKAPLKSYAFQLPSQRDMIKYKRKTKLTLKLDSTEPIVKKDSVKPTSINNDTNLEFTTETENSTETKVQVFFKGVNGKTYPKATPRILVKDVITNQEVTAFNRQIENGIPVPQLVQAGTYNFVLPGFNDLYANNVKIELNKINKITIKVTEGSLQFRYGGNPSRPISEYSAVVNRRFAAGLTVQQKCTDKLYYEPGTYYVEINTTPVSKFSVDLTFGAVYELQIQESGFLQIKNTTKVGKAVLGQVMNDAFLPFYDMNINGDVSKQKLTIQPGIYEVTFLIDPKMPLAGTKKIKFRIESNKTTDLLLE